ncbi:MAG: glycosyltransferase [Actinomycetota bacterium]|jgi:L-malate glycosyltransferase
MGIHQVVAGASAGDAVTNTALGFQGILQRVGPSGIFARYVDPRLDGKVAPLGAYAACADRDDILIYHASIGEPEVVRFLLESPQRLVLVYHNITPARYFVPYDATFANLLATGRRELVMLRDRVLMALAVSNYNANELQAVGYEDVRVSPLPVDPWVLRSLEPDERMVAEVDAIKGPLILFVGQILPHKRPDLLLHAFHLLVTHIRPDANLAMLGPTRLDGYYRALQQQARELNLSNALVPGWLRAEELVAFYRAASLFVTMSEHEGVCVPLLEAMSFDVPVVARAFAAIPETMGNAGILLPPEDDPALVAEALAALLDDEPLRGQLVARGRKRIGEVDSDAAVAAFLDHLASIA